MRDFSPFELPNLSLSQAGQGRVLTMLIRLLLHGRFCHKSVVTQHTCKNLTFRQASSVATNTSPLVDSLLNYTHELMADAGHHTIAFSGGVDSSLVAYLVHTLANTKAKTPTATAVLGLSPAVPAEQVETAHTIAAHIGIPLRTLATAEGSDPQYIANAGEACFACKTHLYTTLAAIHREHSATIRRIPQPTTTTTTTPSDGQDTRNSSNRSESSIVRNHQHLLYNGTNADDMADPTRSGLRAAANEGVLSPLAFTTKADVRAAAAAVGLPNAYAAAAPCLRSRLQWGVPATREHLVAVGAMERFVRDEMAWAFGDSINMRVRLLARNRVCVQVDMERLDEVKFCYDTKREKWDRFFLETQGFQSLEIRSFKSGSVASFGKEVNIQRHVAKT